MYILLPCLLFIVWHPRYCNLLDCESYIHVDFTSLSVIHSVAPTFSLEWNNRCFVPNQHHVSQGSQDIKAHCISIMKNNLA